MKEPTITTLYVLKITTVEPDRIQEFKWEREYYCKTLEEAKETRHMIMTMLSVGADTRPVAYKLLRDKNARIRSIDKSIYMYQYIQSEVEE